MTILARPRIPLDVVAERLGASYPSVCRWATEGLRVRGQTIKLGSLKIGGRRWTSEADVEAFIRATNPDLAAAAQGQPQPVGPSAA